MPGFSWQKVNIINSGIHQLAARLVATIEYEMSHDDFVDTYIPENLREMSRTVGEHFQLGWSVPAALQMVCQADDGYSAQVSFTFANVGGKALPLLPKQFVRQPGHPVEVRVREWFNKRAEMGKQLGIASTAVSKLNELCGSEQQVRYFFPTILLLLENSVTSDAGKEIADKLRAAKTPRSLPSLPGYVREGLTVASGLFTAASFMPEPANRRREVRLDLVANSGSFEFYGKNIQPL